MLQIHFRKAFDKANIVIPEIRNGAWINIYDATESDLRMVADLTGLTYQDIDDSLDPNEIPRVEREDGNIIIFLKSPALRKDGLYTGTITIILNPKFIVTISREHNSTVDYILQHDLNPPTTQPSKLVLYLLLKISQQFTREIRNVRQQVLRYKKSDLEDIRNQDILNLTEQEEVLNQYLSALVPMQNVFETIITKSYIKLYAADNDLFEDLLISINQSVSVCQVNLKSIQSLRDSYQIIFTNTLNKTIQFLTGFTIIVTVPTVIASFYGMNVTLPLQNNPLAFLIIILLTIIVCFVIFQIFHRRGWI